jgi:hypothetical protein
MVSYNASREVQQSCRAFIFFKKIPQGFRAIILPYQKGTAELQSFTSIRKIQQSYNFTVSKRYSRASELYFYQKDAAELQVSSHCVEPHHCCKCLQGVLVLFIIVASSCKAFCVVEAFNAIARCPVPKIVCEPIVSGFMQDAAHPIAILRRFKA